MAEQILAQRIDAHHHLWRYTPAEFGWIDDRMSLLRRDFLADDFGKELTVACWSGSVAVQARQSLEETDWLLSLAAQAPFLRGVVGWAPIASDGFPALLEGIASKPMLKGLRHVIQDEPDESYILGAEFNRGIAAMRGTGLAYDILIFARQLPAAIQFVDRHPEQVFILDHIAKPRISSRELEPWRTDISELARRENVYCKLSGMVTEADWSAWSIEDLRPFVDVVLEAFGPKRLMAGSDWPVCLLASSYRKWTDTLGGLLVGLSQAEQNRILGGTAIEAYNLGRDTE